MCHVRRARDIVLPKTISFPLMQRLALHGANRDLTLPGLVVGAGDDGITYLNDGTSDDFKIKEKLDGACGETNINTGVESR